MPFAEGEVVGQDEPLLEATAPIAEAQLVETVLLNHVTSETSVSSKAARCVEAAAEGSRTPGLRHPERQA